MNKITSFSLVIVVAMILSACNLGGGGTNTTNNTALLDVSALSLGIQVLNTEPLNTAGQTINLGYVVTNIGGTLRAGPVVVLDTQSEVKCPDVNTIGNHDANLDPNESITCTSSRVITQAEVTNGSATITATASAGGVSSQQVTVAVNLAQTQKRELSLTTTPSPTSYNQLGQTISYNYVIKNTGNVTLGPGQFTITDDRIGGQFNCGGATTVLAANDTVTCGATYIIAQADLSANEITNNATASGSGIGPSQTATGKVTNSNVVANPNPSSNLTPGSTIQYKVVSGEWLIQIARCYGASYREVLNANSQIANPNAISPGMVVSVPRIGSAGKIYGPPCVGTHTVQNGDTWESIAQKYNADVLILQLVNPGGISVGRVLKIPLNSAGGNIVSVSPTATPNASSDTEGDLNRINIPAGSDSVQLAGIIPAQGVVRYIVHVNPNNILDVNVSAPVNEVSLTIRKQGGDVIKPTDTTLTWTGTITDNGDYIIRLAGVSGTSNKSFILEVTIAPASS